MKIIKIEANENGSHNNQESNAILPVIPDGWAVIPDDMSIPDSWPFVGIEAEKISVNPEESPVSEGEEDMLWVVTSMTPGIVPEPGPMPEQEPTAEEDLMQMAVDHELRITMLELGVVE